MQIITLATQKGGTGKSSLAVSLAVAAEELGLRSIVLDLDPQATALGWYQRRVGNEHSEAPAVAQVAAPGLQSALDALRGQGADMVFLDTAGVDSPAAVAAVSAAHLVLIPARPSIADIQAAQPTYQSAMKLGKPFAFVINQTPTTGRGLRTADAVRALELAGAVCTTAVAMRADHVDAMMTGQGVTERDPNGKAAAEIRGALRWVMKKVGVEAKHEQGAAA